MLSAVDKHNVVTMESATVRNPRRVFELVTRNHRRFGYQFYDENGVGELAANATGQLIIKEKDSPDGDALAYAASWDPQGEGPGRIYWFDLSLFGEALAALFPDGTVVIKNLVVQLKYTEDGRVLTPPPVACTMHRRYFEDNEEGPEETEDYPPAAEIVRTTEQELTDPQKSQVLTNLGLAGMLCREAVAGPVTFDTEGSNGQYWFDEDTSRLWVYVGGQFRYVTLISAE